MKKRIDVAGGNASALRRIVSSSLACVLLFACMVMPLHAAQDVTTQAGNAANYLKASLDTPGPGDELAVLALLRGSYLNPQEDAVTTYITSILAHIEGGGLAGQSLQHTGLQAISLAAAGLSLEEHAPGLLAALSDEAALDAGGLPAAWGALVLFGQCGVSPPEGFNPEAYAVKLAAKANEDGGFGEGGSNGRDTALALQALAGYESNNEVHVASINAQFWQQLNGNDYSGFNMDGVESPNATAQAVLSISALGYDPAYISYESAPMTDRLAEFQNDSGSFSFAGEPLNKEDNALVALAFMAKLRYDRGKSGIFDFSDVVPLAYSPPAAQPQPGQPSAPQESGVENGQETPNTRTGSVPTWLVVALVAAVVLLLAVLALLYNTSRKPRRRR